MTSSLLNKDKNTHFYMLLVLLVITFITKPIDALLININLINLYMAVFVLYIIFVSSKFQINFNWFLYFIGLVISAFIGFYISDVSTGVLAAPYILEYYSFMQPIKGIVYSSRYMLMMGLIIFANLIITKKQYNYLINITIVFLTFVSTINIVEFFIPSLHQFFLEKGNYAHDFSFVYRGVSLFFNVYDAWLTLVILNALTLYKILKEKKYYWVICHLLSLISIILLGTRSGIVSVLLFYFACIIIFSKSFKKLFRNLAIGAAILVLLVFVGMEVSNDFYLNVISLLTLQDPKGSIQLHITFVMNTLKLFIEHPFGVGIGKTNFAAIDNEIFFNPESFLLALLLDTGLFVTLLFILFNIRLFIICYKKRDILGNTLSSLLISFLIMSVINVQVFNSVIVSVLLSLIIGIYININNKDQKNKYFPNSISFSKEHKKIIVRERDQLFDLKFFNGDFKTAVNEVILLAKRRKKGLVITPNVDHIINITSNRKLKEIYQSALLLFPDGMPIVWLSKLWKFKSLKERITGADLLPAICKSAAKENLNIYFLGGLEGVAEKAKENLQAKYPNINIVGVYSPPFGFENNQFELDKIITDINKKNVDILFVGVGSPKQEIWAYNNLDKLNTGPVLCVGAAFDFAAGTINRAPNFISKMGLEWFWRLIKEPKRMWKRYLVKDPKFLFLAFKELIS